MDGEDRAKALELEERSRGEPGLGTAMLAVAVMLFITAVLSLLIYGLMVAIRPIETRESKAAVNAYPLIHAPGSADPSRSS